MAFESISIVKTVIADADSSTLAPREGQHRVARPSASWIGYAMFILLHLACFAAFFTPITLLALVLAGSCYFLQMFGITAGYHRYFSHRSFKTSRQFQMVLAWLGCSASQNGPSWWVARHRHHHRTSDTSDDLHSPIAHSFWWSHTGWILSSKSDGTDVDSVKDLKRYREIRWLDRNFWRRH